MKFGRSYKIKIKSFLICHSEEQNGRFIFTQPIIKVGTLKKWVFFPLFSKYTPTTFTQLFGFLKCFVFLFILGVIYANNGDFLIAVFKRQ